ncbi:MAG: NTP transferase domain-containing protein, partial [Muribaculaceae bacterium]|nr:NTP transferase domain-containing protein [Muribaculaceae bacterium]
MKAMIFAAGIGSRLKPWTDHHPKALVEIGDRPALWHVINRIKALGVSEMVINVHHFADQIELYLSENNNFGVNIHVSDERSRLLDTGGGLLKAAEFLSGDEPIILHNADIFSNVSLAGLSETHKKSGADATLLVAQRKSSRGLLFDSGMRMHGWINVSTGETIPSQIEGTENLTPLAFGGIQIISPRILRSMSAKMKAEPFSIIPFYANNCE